MKQSFIIFIAALLLFTDSGLAADKFSRLKVQLAEAPALKIHFISIVESEIFESVDSVGGLAMICQDGAYRADFGEDVFIFDGQYLSSYSPSSNQVVIEKPTDAAAAGEQVTFLTKFDLYFESFTVSADREYRLIRLKTAPKSLPDSMVVHLAEGDLAEITFFDLNMDLNRIAVDSVVYLDYCDRLVLKPDFPDSTETVKLY